MEKASKNLLRNLVCLISEKKYRDEQNLFIAEGIKIIKDIILKGHRPEYSIISTSFLNNQLNSEVLKLIYGIGISVYLAEEKDFKRVSSLVNSQGIIAVFKKSSLSQNIMSLENCSRIVLCDGVQDPGNIGAIIRTCVAFGVSHILFSNNCADIYNPKVVRASSGTLLDVSVSLYDMELLHILKSNRFYFYVSQVTSENSKPISLIQKNKKKIVLVFGSEGRGVTQAILELADEFFYIPINDSVESLNVTSALAITLYSFNLSRILH